MCKELRVAGFICVMLPSIIYDWNLDKIAMFQRFGLNSVLGPLNLAQPPIHPHTHPNTIIPKKQCEGTFQSSSFRYQQEHWEYWCNVTDRKKQGYS
jgi:hypothetical protein